MSNKWKIFLFFGATVIMIGLGIFFAIGRNRDNKTASSDGVGQVAGAVSENNGDYINRLSKHLSDNGMVLYGSNQSAETTDQKNLFGGAVSFIDYVDCNAATNSSNSDECVGQNVTVYPTWVYKGDKYEGVQTLSELAKITDFEQ